MVEAGDFLWQGDEDFMASSNVSQFMAWLATERGHHFADYHELWRWSVADIEAFWQAIWDYFQLHSPTPHDKVLSSRSMPGAQWFTGARVNYAEHVLRNEVNGDPSRPFLYHLSELRPLGEMSWQEVAQKTRILATRLRALGIKPGDRVAAYMPNIPETVIAMLATTAIGAVWSSAAPEFGAGTVIDRFSQIEPTIVFVADGYRYGGKNFDRRDDISTIIAALPSVRTVIWMNYLQPDSEVAAMRPAVLGWEEALSGAPVPAAEFEFERVPSDHPLWVLFSSGTTGLPKAIVHGHLGVLLEHYKSAAFHMNIKPGRSVYFYTTTGWMVWNTLMWGPLMNGIAVLYDGDPAHPRPDAVWDIAARTKAQQIGISPTLVLTMQKLGIRPGEKYDLSALEGIFLVGSPATPESFSWLYQNVKSELWVTSQSGGTEFCSGLVGGSPTLAVNAGEIQARTLGADIVALDEDGKEIIGEPGELIIRSPMPSMPIQLWGDKDFAAYRDAYFDIYPQWWRHGDSFTLNARGTCFVHGRSDATLNRYGVRIGSAEIYRTLDTMPEIADSLIVCVEDKNGGFYMPLFVQMREGTALDDAMIARLRQKLRTERSPRHVPDEIIAVPAIPYTLTSKKMEVPVRKLMMGIPLDKAANTGSMKDPGALDWFADFAARRAA